MDRKRRLALQEETSKDIRIMTLEAELDGLRRKVAEMTASDKPAYERTDAVTEYLIAKFEDGSIAHKNVVEIADLLDASLTKHVGLSVDVRFVLDVEVPFDAVKDEVVKSMTFIAESMKFPTKTISTKVTDYNNEKI